MYNISLCYLDDRDSWINLNFDVLRGFTQLWQCALVVPERVFKRFKLHAGVLGSPVQVAVSSSSTSSTVVCTAPLVPSTSEATHNKQVSDWKMNSIAFMSSPVDDLLAWKLENFEKATKELRNITAQKQNFKRELSQTVLLNTGTLSVENESLNWGILKETVMAKTAHQLTRQN